MRWTYPKLFEANREVITDPDLIYPGQKIRIPTENLVAQAAARSRALLRERSSRRSAGVAKTGCPSTLSQPAYRTMGHG